MRSAAPLLLAGVVFGSDSGSDSHGKHGVSGIGQVIDLLTELKEDIEKEGEDEHKEYDEFACFCKDKTEDKSEKIQDSEDEINDLSADIQERSATREEKRGKLAKRKKKDEEMKADLQDEVTRCDKEAARFEYNIADFKKAIKSIEGAKDAITDSKKGASLLHIEHLVKKTVAEADALSLVSAKDGKVLHTFLQSSFMQQGARVDPDDPEYKFHSKPLVDLLDKILKDYEDKKEEVEDDFEAEKKKCAERKGDLVDELDENHDKIAELEEDIDELTTKISDDREDLAAEEETLKEDSEYLTKLTERCGRAAKEYDQRSAMRNDELGALGKALDIMKDKVKDWEDADVDEEGDKEEELFQPRRAVIRKAPALSMMQVTSARSLAHNFLGRATAIDSGKLDRALQVLSKEGARIRSTTLAAVAIKLQRPDPFVKVKSMIQKLIERLLNEAKTEAAHKGFCDEKVKSTMQDRDNRFEEVQALHVRLSDLQATKNRLDEEIPELKEDIKDLEEALDEANKLRDEEKAENIETLLKAKKAVNAVKEAIQILKIFYARAKNTGFQDAKPGEILTAMLQHKDPSFNKGTNRGNQDKGNAVIEEMDQLRINFQNKINTVTRNEKEAAEEHEEFSRTSKADIGGKSMKLKRNKQDLETTVNRMDETVRDLDTQQELTDKALKELKDMKPMCFDNGMSIDERKKKREEELEALKLALCILDPNGKEDDCKKEED